MASPMVCYEIAVNGKLTCKACVAESDMLEAVLAKPLGDREPSLSVTVFSPSSRYPKKHISWETNQLEVGDEIFIRIIEDVKEVATYVKSAQDIESEVESSTFCSFCGKGDREIRSMVAGKEGVFICNECIDLCVEISRPVKKLNK